MKNHLYRNKKAGSNFSQKMAEISCLKLAAQFKLLFYAAYLINHWERMPVFSLRNLVKSFLD